LVQPLPSGFPEFGVRKCFRKSAERFSDKKHGKAKDPRQISGILPALL
jgi:hypothetical protein